MKKLDIGRDGYSCDIGKLSLYVNKGYDGKIQVSIGFNANGDADFAALVDECSDKIGIDIDTDLTGVFSGEDNVTVIDDDKVLSFIMSCLNNGINLTRKNSITDIIGCDWTDAE